MKITKIKSNAKLNLALNVTGKKKALHKIESIISFIDLHDIISINQHNGNKHHISFHGQFSKNIGKKNTVDELFKILDKQNLLDNKKFKVRIKKKNSTRSWIGWRINECSWYIKLLNQKKNN